MSLLEMNIISPKQDMALEPIQWNFEELKKQIAERTEVFAKMVVDKTQIAQAKEDRAKLNNLKKAIDSKRIEMKKTYLEPYDKFEREVKEITKMIDSASNNINVQVRAFEEEERQNKLDRCFEMLLDSATKHGLSDFEPTSGWRTLMDDKWGNASKSFKSIEEEIEEKVTQIKTSLETIEGLTGTPFIFELKKYFQRTLDLGQTLQENERLKRMEEEKKAHLERQQSLLEAEAQEEPPVVQVHAPTPISAPEESKEAERVYTLKFEVTGTQGQLMELSRFMKQSGIAYKQIKE